QIIRSPGSDRWHLQHSSDNSHMMNGSVQGVIFDLDGTLIHQRLDFGAIRREIGLPPGAPLLEALAAMAPPAFLRANAVMDGHEWEAARSGTALPGVEALLVRIDAAGVRRAVLTRNSRASTQIALAVAGLGGFDPLVTRDDGPYKPDPAGVTATCAAWGVRP